MYRSSTGSNTGALEIRSLFLQHWSHPSFRARLASGDCQWRSRRDVLAFRGGRFGIGHHKSKRHISTKSLFSFNLDYRRLEWIFFPSAQEQCELPSTVQHHCRPTQRRQSHMASRKGLPNLPVLSTIIPVGAIVGILFRLLATMVQQLNRRSCAWQ
jgi:hypothetical protein